MATETIDIVVRERGAKKAGRNVAGIGGAGKKAVLGVNALTAALVALAASAAVFGKIAVDSVQASAAMEGFGVRLRALLGSQQGANLALEKFVELSAETPFAVNQIVAGATTLASVTGRNRKQLEDLTLISANLAAVTGLSFEQTAENIQRSMSAGLASADLFRERGVRQLIQEVTGIPDATKLSTTELLEAFKELAGEGGKFGNAAKELALTTTGALSNIGDASFRFKAAFGDALSPAVIGAAKALFIPFFDKLRVSVEDNADAITDFAVGALGGMVRGFGDVLDAGAIVVRFLEDIGLTAGNLGRAWDLLTAGLKVSLAEITLAVQVLRFGAFSAVEGVKLLANAVGLVSDESLARSAKTTVEAQKAMVQSSLDLGDAVINLGTTVAGAADSFLNGEENAHAMSDAMEGAGERARSLADSVEGVADGIRKMRREAAAATDEVDPTAGGIGSSVSAETVKTQEKSLASLLQLQKQLNLERLAGINPLLRQREEINQQIVAVMDMEVALGDQAIQEQLLNDLIAKRDALTDELEGKGKDGVSGKFAKGAASGITEGIQAAITGADTDTLGELFASSFEKNMSTVMDGLNDQLGTLIQQASDSLAQSLGGVAGGGLAGGIAAGIGAGISIGASFLSGGGSSSIRSDMARSAVESTERVRGLVAGPTSVAIGELDLQLEDAVSGLEEIEERSLAELKKISRNTQGGGGRSAGRNAEQIANTETGGLG